MNREMRRLMEREERRQKKQKKEGGGASAKARARAMQQKTAVPGERRSLWRRLVDFLHDVRVEMRKVSWPTREQMVAFTVVTLITTVALTLIIFGLDVGMKEIVLYLIGGASG